MHPISSIQRAGADDSDRASQPQEAHNRNRTFRSTNCGKLIISTCPFLRLQVLFTLLVAFPAYATNTGDEVIVIYNSRLAESKQLAAYYAEKRRVPESQMFGFDLPTHENMTRMEFRDSLQKPLAAALEKRKLWHISPEIVSSTNGRPGHVEWKVGNSSIRYAVLIYGVPLRILTDPNVKEATENVRPELRRNEAAVDSELALLPMIEEKPPLFGPFRNPVYGTTNQSALHPTNRVLMVSRLDGPSPGIARGLLDKALQAERDGLWGRAYFDVRKTSEASYKIGDDMIQSACEMARHYGFETTLDENSGTFPAGFPMSHIAYYVGWYTESVSGPFAAHKVEFMPGAFAYHLHSYSANSLRTTNQHWVGPLLAKGVTATMGTIDEPYLSGTPDMAVFTSRFLLNNFTFGEAALAGQPVLSWQTTVVGDPLYCPFRKSADEIARDLERKKNKLIEWCYVRLLNVNRNAGKPVAQLVALLDQLPFTTNSAVLMEKLSDLYAAQGKTDSVIFACNKALNLDPSPQQRLRLRLTLGERLQAAKRDVEAYENYEKLLAENHDYPDKPAIYKILLALAEKLNKKADAEHFAAELKK